MFRASVLLSVLLIASPVSAQFVSIQNPKPAAIVAQSFSVIGQTGTGVDVLHVWGFAPSGAVFLGSTVPVCPPPGANSVCNYELITAERAALVGTYPIVVYGHDPVTNTFPWQSSVTVTVEKGPNIVSGFGAGSYVNPVDLDDAFTIENGGSGGIIGFGHRWPSPPTCVAQMPNAAVTVATTCLQAIVTVTGGGSLAPIRVMCGGGK